MNQIEPVAAARGNSNDHTRRHNLSLVLGLVHHHRGMSRSQLTQRSGLNRSTIGALVSELVDLDLVREEDAPSGNQVGRPSLAVKPSATPVTIAVNPEIDAIKMGVVGLGGTVLFTARRSVDAVPTAADAVAITENLLEELRPMTRTHRVVGIGVAVPGLVRASDGQVRMAPHLRWHDEPFAAMLHDKTGLPVSVANDARLGARAESEFGAGRQVNDLIYVNGGASGIGAGIIAGGRPLGGAQGFAGELGHTMVNPYGIACHCGAVGCLETEVRRDRLLEVTGLTAENADLLAAVLASNVDPLVTAEVGRQLDLLAVALHNAVNLLNPRLVVLGGFLAALHEARPDRLHYLNALEASADGLDIRPSELGGDQLMIGAGELAFEALVADPAAV